MNAQARINASTRRIHERKPVIEQRPLRNPAAPWQVIGTIPYAVLSSRAFRG